MSKTSLRFSGLLFLMLSALSGCAVFDKGHLDPRVASQVAVSKLDPPAGCEYLGEVKGSAPLGELADAHGDVLRNAVLRGGNYVSVDLVERPVVLGLGSYVVRGRLFASPGTRGAHGVLAAAGRPPGACGPPPDATATRACEPECAAGFTPASSAACFATPAPQAAGPAN